MIVCLTILGLGWYFLFSGNSDPEPPFVTTDFKYVPFGETKELTSDSEKIFETKGKD